MVSIMLLFVILFPMACGIVLMCAKLSRRARNIALCTILGIELAAVCCLMPNLGAELQLFSMTDALTVRLRMDAVSRLFMAVAAGGFFLSGIYATRYMSHSGRENQFYGFFLLTLGALMGMNLSSNLITMYLFFEFTTLLSMPLVLHDRTPEAIRAALKSLFYSIAGAFMALCAIFFLARYADTLEFVSGGSLNPVKVTGHENLLRTVIFLGAVGVAVGGLETGVRTVDLHFAPKARLETQRGQRYRQQSHLLNDDRKPALLVLAGDVVHDFDLKRLLAKSDLLRGNRLDAHLVAVKNPDFLVSAPQLALRAQTFARLHC